jgi:hypothetical protein
MSFCHSRWESTRITLLAKAGSGFVLYPRRKTSSMLGVRVSEANQTLREAICIVPLESRDLDTARFVESPLPNHQLDNRVWDLAVSARAA